MTQRKMNLYHNSAHTQLRVPQGIPEAVAVLPQESSSASEIMSFSLNRVIHVSSQSGVKEHIHVYCTSSVTTDVFIEVIPTNLLVEATATEPQRASSWPERQMILQVRETQTAPQILLQGLTISSGAALSLHSKEPGVLFFGFVVVDV